VLTVQGRKSHQPRSTPVSELTVDGRRYIVGGLGTADWVKNARAAGWGLLARGRHVERVALIELPEAERAPILRAFPREVPAGVGFFRRLYDLPADPAALPDAFAALAPRCAVFRVEPLPTAAGRGA
jgi:deazaflavin-dependent oxidoreductase (nitroreductase family)